jgi:hypothetical protein
VTPSKRAGDTVDESIDDRPVSANGERNGDDHRPNGAHAATGVAGSNGGGRRAKPRRRSVVAAGTAPAPERGTSSQRGMSSSSITKRASERFPEDEDHLDSPDRTDVTSTAAPTVTPDVAEPSTAPAPVEPESRASETSAHDEADGSLAPPSAVAPPAARVGADARRPATGTDSTVMPLPLPVTVPSVPVSQPAEREATTLAPPDELPPDAPYVSSTMMAHGVAPVPRVLGRRPRVRRVTRVVRHVDPWSIFKVAIVFNLVLYGVLLTAGVLLWNVAYATGTIDNLERFFESFGWEQFEFDGGAIYHAAWIAGLFGVVGLTGAVVLAATLFNLITDLVGGVRMTVLEEEVVERTAAPMRRFVVRRPTSGADPSAGLRREVDRLPVRPDDGTVAPD